MAVQLSSWTGSWNERFVLFMLDGASKMDASACATVRAIVADIDESETPFELVKSSLAELIEVVSEVMVRAMGELALRQVKVLRAADGEKSAELLLLLAGDDAAAMELTAAECVVHALDVFATLQAVCATKAFADLDQSEQPRLSLALQLLAAHNVTQPLLGEQQARLVKQWLDSLPSRQAQPSSSSSCMGGWALDEMLSDEADSAVDSLMHSKYVCDFACEHEPAAVVDACVNIWAHGTTTLNYSTRHLKLVADITQLHADQHNRQFDYLKMSKSLCDSWDQIRDTVDRRVPMNALTTLMTCLKELSLAELNELMAYWLQRHRHETTGSVNFTTGNLGQYVNDMYSMHKLDRLYAETPDASLLRAELAARLLFNPLCLNVLCSVAWQQPPPRTKHVLQCLASLTGLRHARYYLGGSEQRLVPVWHVFIHSYICYAQQHKPPDVRTAKLLLDLLLLPTMLVGSIVVVYFSSVDGVVEREPAVDVGRLVSECLQRAQLDALRGSVDLCALTLTTLQRCLNAHQVAADAHQQCPDDERRATLRKYMINWTYEEDEPQQSESDAKTDDTETEEKAAAPAETEEWRVRAWHVAEWVWQLVGSANAACTELILHTMLLIGATQTQPWPKPAAQRLLDCILHEAHGSQRGLSDAARAALDFWPVQTHVAAAYNVPLGRELFACTDEDPFDQIQRRKYAIKVPRCWLPRVPVELTHMCEAVDCQLPTHDDHNSCAHLAALCMLVTAPAESNQTFWWNEPLHELQHRSEEEYDQVVAHLILNPDLMPYKNILCWRRLIITGTPALPLDAPDRQAPEQQRHEFTDRWLDRLGHLFSSVVYAGKMCADKQNFSQYNQMRWNRMMGDFNKALTKALNRACSVLNEAEKQSKLEALAPQLRMAGLEGPYSDWLSDEMKQELLRVADAVEGRDSRLLDALPLAQPEPTKPPATTTARPTVCWDCSGTGHDSRHCPKRLQQAKPKPVEEKKCELCEGEDHNTADCAQAKPKPAVVVETSLDKHEEALVPLRQGARGNSGSSAFAPPDFCEGCCKPGHKQVNCPQLVKMSPSDICLPPVANGLQELLAPVPQRTNFSSHGDSTAQITYAHTSPQPYVPHATPDVLQPAAAVFGSVVPAAHQPRVGEHVPVANLFRPVAAVDQLFRPVLVAPGPNLSRPPPPTASSIAQQLPEALRRQMNFNTAHGPPPLAFSTVAPAPACVQPQSQLSQPPDYGQSQLSQPLDYGQSPSASAVSASSSLALNTHSDNFDDEFDLGASVHGAGVTSLSERQLDVDDGEMVDHAGRGTKGKRARQQRQDQNTAARKEKLISRKQQQVQPPGHGGFAGPMGTMSTPYGYSPGPGIGMMAPPPQQQLQGAGMQHQQPHPQQGGYNYRNGPNHQMPYPHSHAGSQKQAQNVHSYMAAASEPRQQRANGGSSARGRQQQQMGGGAFGRGLGAPFSSSSSKSRRSDTDSNWRARDGRP